MSDLAKPGQPDDGAPKLGENDSSENQPPALPKEIRKIVDQSGIPATKKEQLVGRLTEVFVEHNFFMGPIPPPALMRQYGEIIPNGAERIMSQAERQSAHRQKLENRVVSHGIAQGYVGQTLAAIVAGAFLVAAYKLGMAGHDVLAGILGGSTVVALVTAFIIGRSKQGHDLADKRRSMPKPPAAKRRK